MRPQHRPVASLPETGLLVALVVAAAVGAASCGGSRASAGQGAAIGKSGAGAASRPPAPGAPDVPWSKKTRAQRMEFMGLAVFPEMKRLFQEHDGKGFAQFRCQTCHGEDMEAVDFRMPNGLYALPQKDPVEAALEYDEKTARFMVDAVVPAMQELLGRNDPAMAAGFDCHECHQKE